MNSHRLTLMASAVLLAACTPDVVKNAAPPISTLADKKAPDANVLPIQQSAEVPISPELAAENYRELLKLQPDEDTKRESMRRLADLSVGLEDEKGDSESGQAAMKDAIRLYNELLYARPDAKDNDRVFYQLARAYQNIGEADAAIDTLRRLTERHPDSSYADDAHFRRAELLFSRGRYADAEIEYQLVMALKDRTPFFEASQYKLGWARYKQSNYEGALEIFVAILDRELPPGELVDPKAALDKADPKKGDLARDALRVVGLSLAAMGSGPALSEYLTRKGDPRFYPMLYVALADLLLEKRRYSDSANTYAAFITRYPKHALGPDFQSRVIATYFDGGFKEQVIKEKERYATLYDPVAPYWAGLPPRAAVMQELRKHYEDLGKHYFAQAQAVGRVKPQPGQPPESVPRYLDPQTFLTAGRWFKRILEVFPTDPRAAEINFVYAESLLYGARLLDAAQEYTRVAYEYPAHPRTNDAAYGAVLTYQQHARDVPKAQRLEALKLAVASAIQLAEKLPDHPQAFRVLTRSAEDLFELKDYAQVIAVAARVINTTRPVEPQLRRQAWSLTADSHFQLKQFAEAEVAYGQELRFTPPNTQAHAEVSEQLAVSIYRQGEAARDAGDQRRAAQQFLRVGQVVPTAKIRATAEYDAAAMLIQVQDWAQAAVVLENFRRQFPGHPLEADVDKKLAVSYQKDNKPIQAAQTYLRIAQRTSETPDVRREAGWLAATLFDSAKDVGNAVIAYEAYVTGFPRPLDRAQDARQRLADVARERGDSATRQRWLRELIAADESAGSLRTAKSKAMGATAALEFARGATAEAKTIRLTAPLDKSLPRKRQAMEAAVRDLGRAANYGFAEITTAATHELGLLYQDFAKALKESERPRSLGALELEQYDALLEEQAFPFEEKAIATYESNLRRIPQGIYDTSVASSVRALAELAPAKYGKREKGEDFYATLR